MSPPEANIRRNFERLLLETYPQTIIVRTHGGSIPVGFPDVVAWIPAEPWAVPIAIEYKAPGEAPRRVQAHWLNKLMASFVVALVVDDPETGVRELGSIIRGLVGGTN